MVGTLTVAGSRVLETTHPSSPCLCVDALPCSTVSLMKGGGEMTRIPLSRKTSSPLQLGSSFVESGKALLRGAVNGRLTRKQSKSPRRLVIVDELAGQYEDSFEDVKTQMLNYFTYKAVRTVLHQLYEMNPPHYTWFYNFVASNKPGDGKRFLKVLVKENQELAERVMTTRLHLYGKWIKKCNHAEIYKEISDENLELMRERLKETVIWPSDDTNPDMIA